MKKIILITLIIIGGIYSNNVTAQTKVNNDFKVHLTMLYEHYINLKSAFISSNVESVMNMAKEVQREFPNVEKASKTLKESKTWEKEKTNISKSITAILSSKKIEEQRNNFATLSIALHDVIKTYGVIGMKTYYQYCPMALNGKGAYWLSLQEKIQNPYFGDKMLTCGETKEILE